MYRKLLPLLFLISCWRYSPEEQITAQNNARNAIRVMGIPEDAIIQCQASLHGNNDGPFTRCTVSKGTTSFYLYCSTKVASENTSGCKADD